MSDATAPTLISGITLPAETVDVSVAGDFAYLADEAGRIQVVDVSRPAALRVVNSRDSGTTVYGVKATASDVFVAAGLSGLIVAPTQCATVAATGGISVARLAFEAWPNPTTGATAIRLVGDLERPVSVAIYDLAGRRIRRLPDGDARADGREIWWDGRDDSGRSVASGVYMVSASTPHGIVSTRVVMLR